MQVTTVVATFQGKLGLPDYSHVIAGLEATATLDEGEDPAETIARLFAMLKEATKIELREARRTRLINDPPDGPPREAREAALE